MLLSQRENLGALQPGFSELGFTVFALVGWFPHGDPSAWGVWDLCAKPCPNQWPLLGTPGRGVEQPL